MAAFFVVFVHHVAHLTHFLAITIHFHAVVHSTWRSYKHTQSKLFVSLSLTRQQDVSLTYLLQASFRSLLPFVFKVEFNLNDCKSIFTDLWW